MKTKQKKIKISSLTIDQVMQMKTDHKLFQKVLRDNENFIHRIIHRINYNKMKSADGFADAFQEGCIGLWNAVLSFNPERAASFSTYSHTCITNAVLGKAKELHKKTGQDTSIELFKMDDEGGENGGEYYENRFVVSTKANIYYEIDRKIDQEAMIKKLSKLDATIYKMRVLEMKNLKDIYPALEMKKGTFSLYYYKVFLPKMKKLYGEQPWMN